MIRKTLTLAIVMLLLITPTPSAASSSRDVSYEEVYQWNLMVYNALPSGGEKPRAYREPDTDNRWIVMDTAFDRIE